MQVIPQYKVIGPYNYDRIIRNIEKNYDHETRFRSDKSKGDLILKIKKCLIRKSKRFQTP